MHICTNVAYMWQMQRETNGCGQMYMLTQHGYVTNSVYADKCDWLLTQMTLLVTACTGDGMSSSNCICDKCTYMTNCAYICEQMRYVTNCYDCLYKCICDKYIVTNMVYVTQMHVTNVYICDQMHMSQMHMADLLCGYVNPIYNAWQMHMWQIHMLTNVSYIYVTKCIGELNSNKGLGKRARRLG